MKHNHNITNFTRPHVLVLYGGESSEHAISILSARTIYQALSDSGHNTSLAYITRQGKWLLVDSVIDSATGSTLTPEFGTGSLRVDGSTKRLKPTVIFPVLHGSNGEDGTVQSVAQLLHIPCVGPSIISAVVTINKDLTKRLLRDAGIKTARWITWRTHDKQPSYDEISNSLGVPFFVKPVDAGSSIGVTKVHNQGEYFDALTGAAKHSKIIIIEEFIDGREFEVAVMGDGTVSGVGEVIPGDEFYSYHAKYDAASSTHTNINPRINTRTKTKILDIACRAYLATYGTGMARVDFIVTSQGGIFVNEINGIPGFTDVSMFPKLWEADGISIKELVSQLVREAIV